MQTNKPYLLNYKLINGKSCLLAAIAAFFHTSSQEDLGVATHVPLVKPNI